MATRAASTQASAHDESVDSPLSDGWVRRRERMTLQIERAALELFASRPADDITVEQIAHAAGISKRTFFRYFSSRDEVLTVMPARQVQALCARVAARPPEEGVLEAFVAAVHLGEGDDAAHDDLIYLWGQALRRGSGLVQLGATNGPQMMSFCEVIAEREHLSPEAVEVRAWSAAIAAIISASFVTWLEAGGEGSLPTFMEEWLIALGDLGMQPPARRRARRRR